MTRNPGTTEAARTALLARLSRILGEVPIGTLDLLNVLTGPDCAPYTAAVLAVSPAVTEGERSGRRVPPPNYALAGTVSDELGVRAAPPPAVTAAEDETHGYCTCDGPRPMRDCGVKAHRDQAFAARPAPVVAAVPADPNSED